jgi:phosphatidylinositol glycan class W
MMAITCIAILAVDFRVFPRRFAKVENWGTSLMDMGVGSFVFSSGIVSVRSLVKANLTNTKTPSLGKRLLTAVRHSTPLLVLGFVRLAMVKGVDYAEHVTEYGVHWNFFFTLGLLPPFVALLQSLAVGKDLTIIYTALSLGVALVYQTVLHSTGLEAFVLVGDRHTYGLIGLNKEGISSFCGYLSIFLAGMGTGSYILPLDSKNRVLKQLLAWSVFWTATFYATNSYHGLGVGVSRRLANLPYVLWVASFNTMQLVAFYLVERSCFADGRGEEMRYTESVPVVLEAVNRNGLVVFLVANLLTGLVNVSVKTLEVGDAGAVGILVGYMVVVVGAAVGLHWRGVTVKL